MIINYIDKNIKIKRGPPREFIIISNQLNYDDNIERNWSKIELYSIETASDKSSCKLKVFLHL